MISKFCSIVYVYLIVLIVVKTAHSWKYQTKCTQISKNSFHNNNNISTYSDIQTDGEAVYSIADDFDRANPNNINNNNNHNDIITSNQNRMQLKCANSNDFLFIGLTQYGVNIKPNNNNNNNNNNTCSINVNDCLVTVDYLSNECNGLNSCDIQLDAQFLHTCKNMSDYLSVAYECIPGSKRIDVCSNEETFIVDNNLSNSRFSNFFLTSPGYPNEYSSNLNNCSCKLEYVQIDDNPQRNKLNTELKQAKMNLVFKTFEFDLEEGESTHSDLTNTVYSEKCNKDVFALNSFESNQNHVPSESLTLCGQHKEFKEFYMNGGLVRFNLTSDDAITRRGFLIEIKPTPETVCPYGTERFDSKKCIKYFNEKNALNWADAVDSCKSKSGRLLTINDFVDNLKLNNLLRSKSVDVGSVWSAYQSNSRSSHEDINFLNVKRSTNSRCMSKSLSYWQDEPCNSQLAYICEFDPIYLNQKQLVSNDNRLIRVSCGSISSVYTTSSSSTSSTTTIVNSKKIPKRKQIANNKPIISWSSLIDKNINIMKTTRRQQPSLPPPTQLSNVISDLFTTTLKSAIVIKEEPSDTLIIEQEKLIINKSEISTKPLNSTTLSNSGTAGMISQELALIIAVICGFSIVFIVVNVFCIWNYYNRKLKAFIEKSETNTESNYRTSTLISRNAKMSSSGSNNRSMSTVDSYVKMLPNYETCVNVPNYLQFTANSSPNSTACLLNSTNEQKIEILKNYLQKQSQDQNQQHYYETLSINKQNYNDYIMEGENNNFKQFFSNNNQFDSMIVLPVTSVPASSSSSSMHANSTVVLLNNNSLKQLQNNLMLNEIMASVSMPSPASNSQTKPLLTFSSNSDNSSSSSSSTSPAPAEL